MTRPRLGVAYSGGRDSTALLHATLVAAAALDVEVVALHVHHGLSAHADAWLAHCERQCARWAERWPQLAFAAERLAERPPPGASVEAWARSARYAALRRLALARGAPLVLLGQHRRDQAETLLLQALRGGGARGLAAMPRVVERAGVSWARPWLGRSREAVEQYIAEHALAYVDDDSNADRRFARNRLRHDVWPALTAAFPQAEAALATSACWAADAAAVLDEVARADLDRIGDGDGIDLARWRGLSPERRRLALRHWLAGHAGRAPPQSLARRLVAELATDRAAHWSWGGFELRSYRGGLVLARGSERALVTQGERAAAAADRSPTAPPTHATERCSARAASLSIGGPGSYAVPGWHGALRVDRVEQGGIEARRLDQLELRPRAGAERFQAGPGRPARSLKKQYQARGVAAWDRAGPLVYSAGELIFVPGLGIDARAVAPPGVEQYALGWLPQAPT